MFAVHDTPQDSTGFTQFEFCIGIDCILQWLLERIWSGEEEDAEVKTAYWYVVDLLHDMHLGKHIKTV